MRPGIAFLGLFLLGFAPAPLPKPDKLSDLRKMQGEWVRVSVSVDGKPQGGLETLSVKDDMMQFRSAYDRWKVVLDATSLPPKIDFHHTTSSNGSPALIGIYRLEADTRLTICVRFDYLSDK